MSAAPVPADAPESPYARIARDFAASPLALGALAAFALLLLAAVCAPLISPQNPYDLAQLDITDARLAPGATAAARRPAAGVRWPQPSRQSKFVPAPLHHTDDDH